MIERFIRNNIKNLNPHLTMGFLESKGIFPTEDEAIVITNFLKENSSEIMRGNKQSFLYLKGSIREEVYEKSMVLLQEYFGKYL